MKGHGFRRLATVSAILLVGAFSLSPWVPDACSGTFYYVAKEGSDLNPGTISRPWKTIQRAAAIMRPGDVALIKDGTYSGAVRPGASGTPDAYIAYKAYPGHRPVITSAEDVAFRIEGRSYIEVNGLTITSTHPTGTGVHAGAAAHHVRILNNTITGNGESGIGTGGGADYIFIEGNTIHSNCRTSPVWQGSGISLWQLGWHDASPGFHNVIRRNRIHDNRLESAGTHSDANGIIVDESGSNPPVLIENNIVFNNGGRCVVVYKSANATIVNNTCYMNNADPQVGDCGICTNASSNVRAYNNVVFSREGIPTTASFNSQNAFFDYNLSFNGPVRERGSHDIFADPKFVNPGIDPATADFRLRGDSPAIDRGTPDGAAAVDYDGVHRPLGAGHDIGAFEYSGSLPEGRKPDPPSGLRIMLNRLIDLFQL